MTFDITSSKIKLLGFVLLKCVPYFFSQFCQQVSAEGWGLLRSAGTVPEGYWDLRAGMLVDLLCTTQEVFCIEAYSQKSAIWNTLIKFDYCLV